MQVSAVSVSDFFVFGNIETSSVGANGTYKISNPLNNAYSSNSDLYENINEWKAFCIEQIDANNIDFIA